MARKQCGSGFSDLPLFARLGDCHVIGLLIVSLDDLYNNHWFRVGEEGVGTLRTRGQGEL
jgi:hypothetical protein